jgi:hypothetical protein
MSGKKGGAVMKRRGIVLELEERKAVVLTPDGDFCRIPRAGKMEVGMEVAWREGFLSMGGGLASFAGRRSRQANHKWRSMASGLAAAVVIGAGVWGYIGFMHPPEAYAWVSLDVNPSISLKIDKSFRVHKAFGTDADGKTLVSAVDLVGLTLSQATAQVLSYANSHHYLVPQSGILVAVSPIQKGVTNTDLSAAAEQAVQNAIRADQSVQLLHPSVFAVAVPQTVWQAANQAHVSPGRLMSVLVAAMEGQKTGILDVQGAEIVQVWSNPLAKQAALQIQSNIPANLTRVLESLTGSTNAVTTTVVKGSTGTSTSNQVSSTAENTSPPGKSVAASHQGTHPPGPGEIGNMASSIGKLEGSLSGHIGNFSSQADASKHGNTASKGKAGGKNFEKGQGSENRVVGQTSPIGNFASAMEQNAATGQGDTSIPEKSQGGWVNQRNTSGNGSNHGHDKKQTSQWQSNNSITIHLGNQTLTIPLKVDGDSQWQSNQTNGGQESPWQSQSNQGDNGGDN